MMMGIFVLFLDVCVGSTNAVQYYKMVRPFSTTGLENLQLSSQISETKKKKKFAVTTVVEQLGKQACSFPTK